MTEHDPALVERLAEAYEVCTDSRVMSSGILAVLDLLAAEGRLIEPRRPPMTRAEHTQRHAELVQSGKTMGLSAEDAAEVISWWSTRLPHALSGPNPECRDWIYDRLQQRAMGRAWKTTAS